MKPTDGVDSVALERFCRGESSDAYRLFGCHALGGGKHRFTVWAPHARSVSLVGDFNGWSPLPMRKLPHGAWSVVCAGVCDGQVYKYQITAPDGTAQLKSDPFAAHWETPPADGSKVWDRGGYVWNDAVWREKQRERDVLHRPMSIYEVHLGSWRAPAPGAVFPN